MSEFNEDLLPDPEPAWEDMTPEQQAAVDGLYDEHDPLEYCSHCGKAFEDFSDLGCGYCDRRSPGWGIMP